MRLSPFVLSTLLSLSSTFSSFVSIASAQELNCRVTLDLSSIPASARENLASFKAEVEQYLNNTPWTDEDYQDERIDCSINIFVTEVLGPTKYAAKVFISSARPVLSGVRFSGMTSPILRIIDDRWEFEYIRGKAMIQNDFSFDSFTDFFDFYALLIVGFDLDSFEELKGTRSFQRALSICTQGGASSSAREWAQSKVTYSRFGIVDELTNNKYQAIRQAYFQYHVNGVDLITTERPSALANIENSIMTIGRIRDMQNPRSVLVRTFFDAKYGEIADLFRGYPSSDFFDRLIQIDPSHQTAYEEARRAR